MTQFRKFIRLSFADRSLIVQSMVLVWGIRLGLWLMPFQTLRRCLRRFMNETCAADDTRVGTAIDRGVWAVIVASRYAPTATCLTQALATQVLLGWRGYQTRLHIGVTRNEAGQFQAHAWLENHGRVVIGGPESHLEKYTSLPTLS